MQLIPIAGILGRQRTPLRDQSGKPHLPLEKLTEDLCCSFFPVCCSSAGFTFHSVSRVAQEVEMRFEHLEANLVILSIRI